MRPGWIARLRLRLRNVGLDVDGRDLVTSRQEASADGAGPPPAHSPDRPVSGRERQGVGGEGWTWLALLAHCVDQVLPHKDRFRRFMTFVGALMTMVVIIIALVIVAVVIRTSGRSEGRDGSPSTPTPGLSVSPSPSTATPQPSLEHSATTTGGGTAGLSSPGRWLPFLKMEVLIDRIGVGRSLAGGGAVSLGISALLIARRRRAR